MSDDDNGLYGIDFVASDEEAEEPGEIDPEGADVEEVEEEEEL